MRERKIFMLLVLGTFFLVLFNLPESVSIRLRNLFRDAIASYQGGVMKALTGLQRTSLAVGGGSEVVQERDRLRSEVTELRARAQAMDRTLRENQELHDLLGLRRQLGFRTEACQVIARDDGYGWWQTVRLDKGRRAGIHEAMPVVTPEGVVGKTIEVSDETCDVLLISDRNFKVGVRFDKEGSFGVLHGGGVSLRGAPGLAVTCAAAPAEVDYVRKDLTLAPGETVTTSGLGGVFPAGLVVGRVRQTAMDESGLYQVVTVVPAADLARLHRVLVLVAKERNP